MLYSRNSNFTQLSESASYICLEREHVSEFFLVQVALQNTVTRPARSCARQPRHCAFSRIEGFSATTRLITFDELEMCVLTSADVMAR
jgi:hypothetical protein